LATHPPQPNMPSGGVHSALLPVQLVMLSDAPLDAAAQSKWRQHFDAIVLRDLKGLAAQRCDAQPGTALLLRPDQHICARWRSLQAEALQQALRRATGH